jgi:DNA-binding PadR family transcriptional regulator
MARDIEDTLLFALIEAGGAARLRLAEPLTRRGLLAGDDAIILALSRQTPREISGLGDEIGMPTDRLDLTLARLGAEGLIEHTEIGEDYARAVALTPEGLRVAALFADHWMALEDALEAAIEKKKKRKKLKHKIKTLREALLADLDD